MRLKNNIALNVNKNMFAAVIKQVKLPLYLTNQALRHEDVWWGACVG
jgi:hypothetical protein